MRRGFPQGASVSDVAKSARPPKDSSMTTGERGICRCRPEPSRLASRVPLKVSRWIQARRSKSGFQLPRADRAQERSPCAAIARKTRNARAREIRVALKPPGASDGGITARFTGQTPTDRKRHDFLADDFGFVALLNG